MRENSISVTCSATTSVFHLTRRLESILVKTKTFKMFVLSLKCVLFMSIITYIVFRIKRKKYEDQNDEATNTDEAQTCICTLPSTRSALPLNPLQRGEGVVISTAI